MPANSFEPMISSWKSCDIYNTEHTLTPTVVTVLIFYDIVSFDMKKMYEEQIETLNLEETKQGRKACFSSSSLGQGLKR